MNLTSDLTGCQAKPGQPAARLKRKKTHNGAKNSFPFIASLRGRLLGRFPGPDGLVTGLGSTAPGITKTAIVEHIRDACDQRDIRLGLVLMPGRSFIEGPGSPSEMFQDYLRRKIVEQKEHMGVRVIDLASLLRERYQTDGGRWYHPHEGHLTSAGHRVIADILSFHL